MTDRQELIVRSIARSSNAFLDGASEEILRLQRELSAAGRLNSGHQIAGVREIVRGGFQKACISGLNKVQLEAPEAPTDLAGLVGERTFTPLRKQFRDLYMETIEGSFRTFDILTRQVKRTQADTEIEAELLKLQENAVEEFQLAVTRQRPSPRSDVRADTFVDQARIAALVGCASSQWDFSRLVRLCEELNICWQHGAHHAVAMLTRAILDHCPPLFGLKSFQEVANNHGPKSFKDTMKSLEGISRSIADGHLHTHIRKSEVLPNSNQVDFRPGIDLLLSEIIRLHRTKSKD